MRHSHRDSRGRFTRALCMNPGLETGSESGYTDGTKSESFQFLPKRRVESVLAPLLQGKSVILRMTYKPKGRFEGNYKAVVITPGQCLGTDNDTCLVSIVNGGCAPVTTDLKRSVAKLVLAGMPAHLATQLVREFVRIHQE